jgi:hypothetical protein
MCRPDGKNELAVDYVRFVDGSSWGDDTAGPSERISGYLAGYRSGISFANSIIKNDEDAFDAFVTRGNNECKSTLRLTRANRISGVGGSSSDIEPSYRSCRERFEEKRNRRSRRKIRRE